MGKSSDDVLNLTDELLAALSRTMPGELSSKELDVLESKANYTLSTIRSLRNMSSPVHNIPIEVLGLIFTHLDLVETPQSFLPDISSYEPPCYAHAIKSVSYVCRKWREAALAFPALWSNVRRSEGPFTLLSIERSKDTFLNVFDNEILYPSHHYWGSPTPPGSPKAPSTGGSIRFLDALAEQGHRIKELHIVDADAETLNATILPSTPLPALEALTLTLNFRSQPSAWGNVTTGHWQPDNLFDGVTPMLEKLTLQRCPAFRDHTFSGLTHLCIANQVSGHQFTLGRFLDVLRASPELQELTLVECGPDLDESTHAKVFLGHLRILCLGLWGMSSHISALLDYLIIPHPIEFFLWSAGIDDGSTLHTIFPLHATQGHEIQELRLTSCSREAPYRSPMNGNWRSDHHYSVIANRTTLQVDGRLEPSNFLFDAPTLLNLSSVKELWLGTSYGTEPTIDEWRTFFFSLPSLVTLVISRRSSHGIISSLTLPKQNPHSDLLCPDLETLRIYNDPLLSVLRLSIFAEQRDRRGKRLKVIEIISGRKTDPTGSPNIVPYGGPVYQSPGGMAPWSPTQSGKPWPDAVVADLMHLEEYVDKVDCERVVTDMDWDVVSLWPPKVFNWLNRVPTSKIWS